MRKFVFLIAILGFATHWVNAQKYVFTNYSVDQGLAQSQVRSLYQDSRGDLWIGTLGGVSRFDGIEFVNFNSSSGLIGNQINAIIETKSGELAFGSQGGISIFNGREFTNYQYPEELSAASTNDIIQTGDSLLIATSKGLFSFKNKKLSVVNSHSLIANQNIKTIKPVEGGLAILTKKELYFWSASQFELLFSVENIAELVERPPDNFMDLEVTSDKQFYITTPDQGLIHIFDDTVEQLDTSSGLSSTVCSDISLDKEENPLVSSLNGFNHLKPNNLIAFKNDNGLNFEDVRIVIEDKDGTLWAGTNGAGLFKFSGYAFTYFDEDVGLSSSAVMTIGRLNTGEMLFGTYDAGVSIAGKNDWKYLTEVEITNSRVWAHAEDKNGLVYLGTSSGVDVLKDGKVIDQITTEDGLDYKKVTSLFFDSENTLWIGTSKGINVLKNGVIINFPDFKGDKIRDIFQDKAGDLFLASRQGVWKLKGREFTLLKASKLLKQPLVYCLEESKDGLLMGTKEGLFLAKGDSLIQINISENFNANTINFLQKDIEENLWVGTNYGLFMVLPNMNVISYSKQDGLVNLETNLNAVFSDKKALWFGTSLALQRLDFKELNKQKLLEYPKVNLKEVKLNLEHTKWSEYTPYFRSGSVVPASPEVGYKNNNFQFIFSTNTLDEPEKLVYQYMMEGYDNAWQPITNSNIATYTNLPYNDFQFKVRAKRLGEEWGETLSYAVKINPPFWQTWWFILLTFLALGYIAFSVFEFRRKNLITTLEKEKFELKSKMLSLEQQSLNSSMNRHFIFNALNSIQYFINRQDRLSANKYLSSFAKLIRKNLDASQVNFTTLGNELERLELYLEIENMRFKDKFEFSISVSEDIDEEATQIPSMLLQPYLENSIWHGILPQEKKGMIDLSIVKNPIGQMEIRIKDNGIGISTSQALKNGKANHISKGMKITSGRIQLLQNLTHQKVILIGPFELKNEAGNVEGTQVTIKLPLQYNKKQIV